MKLSHGREHLPANLPRKLRGTLPEPEEPAHVRVILQKIRESHIDLIAWDLARIDIECLYFAGMERCRWAGNCHSVRYALYNYAFTMG